ncbi:MAG TPA: ABC transporter permease [Gemmatimonadaceae bacterium]|nr:ABC transporter permease [Gemmatimonadaceae bacterium]
MSAEHDTPPATTLPAIARWLLGAAAPPEQRPYLLDDLAEELAARTSSQCRVSATLWLLSQVARSLGPLAVARLHARRVARSAHRHAPQGDPMLTQLQDDLRFSLRVALRRPWLSLTVIATMAVGVGSTTAVFSIIDALLIRPLSFAEPEQLVRLASPVRDAPGAMVVSYADLTDWQRESRSIASLGLYNTTTITGQVQGDPERLGAVMVGPGFAETLRLRPALGRLFQPDDYRATGPRGVIITDAFWRSHFAGAQSVIGQAIVMGGERVTIIGVLPKLASAYPTGPAEDFDIWIPLVVPDDSFLRDRFVLQLSGIARLRPGVTLEQANAELAAFARRLAVAYPQTNVDRTIRAIPLRDTIVGPVRPLLILLGLAVAAVLLIACANLGSLLLAHSQARVREFAVRAAIGGATSRIARQLFVESLMLAVIGGAAGVWLARSLVRGLLAVYPTQLPRAGEIALDWRVLLVSLGATMLAGVLAALPLARQVRRLDLVRDLRESERGLGSRARRRVLDGLVVGQVATSVALLFGATLLMRTFMDMTAIKPGFDARNVLAFTLSTVRSRNSNDERRSAFFNGLLDSLRAIPGVQDAAWGMFMPLGGGGWGDAFVRVGSADVAPNLPSMQVKMVSPTYASTLRVPLVAGRALERSDRRGSPDVALVNAALAAAYYPGTSPVGKRIVFQKRTLEIVGVIGNVRNQSLWTPPVPELYVPIEQWGWRDGALFVRATTERAAFESRLREIMRAMDPSIPVVTVRTLDERVRRSMAPERFRAILLGTLAALALLLSVLGIYGLVAWVVGRRTREIGIRMALGEAGSRIRLHVLRDAVTLGAVGVTLGAVLALGSAKYLQAFVAGDVRPRDPFTLLATMALFLLVTAAAAWIPARRASRVDPLQAIRAD